MSGAHFEKEYDAICETLHNLKTTALSDMAYSFTAVSSYSSSRNVKPAVTIYFFRVFLSFLTPLLHSTP